MTRTMSRSALAPREIKRVVIYCRISLDKTGEALGVERQENECRAFAAERGWTVIEVLVDNDLSATSGKVRPAFEKLLKYTGADAILVWHIDRLMRLTKDLERVIDTEVAVHAVHAGFLDLTTPSGRMVARQLTAVSTYEGELKAERQRASHYQRAQAGKAWWTTRPFGHLKDGSLAMDEAMAVRAASAALLDGSSLMSIAKSWNERDLLSPRQKNWTGMMVRSVLLNCRIAGIRARHGVEIAPGLWTPIVDEPTFRQVQRYLASPERRRGGGRTGARSSLLTGFARCGKCGGRFSATSRTARSTGKVTQLYVCREGNCITYPRQFLDNFVSVEVVSAVSRFGPGLLKGVGEDDTQEMRTRVDEIERKMNDLLEDYIAEIITREMRNRAFARLQPELDDLKARLASQSDSSTVSALFGVKDVAGLWQQWMDEGFEKPRSVIEEVLESVTVAPRRKGQRAAFSDITLQWIGADPSTVREPVPVLEG